MKKKITIYLPLLCLFFLLSHTTHVYAYTLPYPSYMPGNKMYTISRVIDSLKAYWYFGNIAKVKYYLSLSDKYLVEAKTLYEYKQYLLATDALDRSATAWKNINPYLLKAEAEGKDVSQLSQIIKGARDEHVNIILLIKTQVPEVFLWSPEKAEPTELPLYQLLETHKQMLESYVIH